MNSLHLRVLSQAAVRVLTFITVVLFLGEPFHLWGKCNLSWWSDQQWESTLKTEHLMLLQWSTLTWWSERWPTSEVSSTISDSEFTMKASLQNYLRISTLHALNREFAPALYCPFALNSSLVEHIFQLINGPCTEVLLYSFTSSRVEYYIYQRKQFVCTSVSCSQ